LSGRKTRGGSYFTSRASKGANAATYDRKSSVTNRSATQGYFFRRLRIGFSAARLFRLDRTSASTPSPSASMARQSPFDACAQASLVSPPAAIVQGRWLIMATRQPADASPLR
jgi:hypothetical protein